MAGFKLGTTWWRNSWLRVCNLLCLLYLCFSLNPQTQRDSMHALKQAPGLTVGQGLVIEGVVTFNLVAVALFVTIPGKHTKLATLAIGFVKGTGLLAAVSLQFIRVKCWISISYSQFLAYSSNFCQVWCCSKFLLTNAVCQTTLLPRYWERWNFHCHCDFDR